MDIQERKYEASLNSGHMKTGCQSSRGASGNSAIRPPLPKVGNFARNPLQNRFKWSDSSSGDSSGEVEGLSGLPASSYPSADYDGHFLSLHRSLIAPAAGR